MKLEQQIKIWERTNKWDKIIKAIEKIDYFEREPEEDLALAKALIKKSKGKWSRRADNEEAVQTLMVLAGNEETMDEYEYFMLLGTAFYNLEQWGKASQCLVHALDLNPPKKDKEAIDKLLNNCHHGMHLPLFEETFNSRVAKAWRTFENRQTEFLNAFTKLNQEKENQTDKEELDNIRDKLIDLTIDIQGIFRGALFDVNVSVEREDNKNVIFLSPGYSLMRAFECAYVKEQAPAAVQSNWDIRIGYKDKLSELLSPDKAYEESIKQTQFWLEKEKDEVFQFNFYFSQNVLSEEAMEKMRFDLINSELRNVLEQVVIDKYLWPVEPLSKPKTEPGITMSNLPEFLKSKGVPIGESPIQILETSVSYTRTPTEKPEPGIYRVDITSGTSKCMKMLLDYGEETDNEIETLEADGATAGFFAFSIKEPEGASIGEARKAFQESVKKDFLDVQGPNVVKIVGEATGEQYDYVDVIVWDFASLLNGALAFFLKSEVNFAAFQTFREGVGTVVLINGESDEERKAMLENYTEATKMMTQADIIKRMKDMYRS